METISRYLLTFLLNSLWQISAIAGVAALACRLMRQGPAGHRHAVWAVALAASLLLPLASIRTGEQTVTPTVRYAPPDLDRGTSAGMRTAPVSKPAPVAKARTVPFGQRTANVLLAAYLVFLTVRLGRFVWAWRRTIQIGRSARVRTAPEVLDRVWTRCRQAFGVSAVELLSSQDISSPAAMGAWRRIIILPEALFGAQPEDVLAAAVGHEMAHTARHDFVLNVVYELLYLPLAFHPAARIVRRGIERTREMACDELVTRKYLEAGVYARSVMSIAATMTGLRVPGHTLGVFDGDILEERIRRLVDRPAANLKRARLLLATGLSALAVCAVLASGLAVSARAQSGSRGEMKLAADAYNGGDFKSAVQHFGNAVRLDPTNLNAKLFLANALMREFFAEVGQPDSPLMVAARQQYLDVLASDPHNRAALRGMVAVAMDTKRPVEAHDWALKVVQADPRDKTSYYTVGVVDWTIVFPEFVRTRQAAGMKPDEYFIPDARLRKSLRDRFMPNLEEGVRMLQTALELDPADAAAMAYMNLMDRLKASFVDSQSESQGLIASADTWVGKAIAIRKRDGKEQAHEDVSLDVDGPPPGPASARAVLAPPPPPPPPPASAKRPPSADGRRQ